MWHWSEPGRIYEGSEEQAGYQLVTTAVPQLRPHHPEMFTLTQTTTATTTTTTTTNRVNSTPVGFTVSPQVTLLSSATKQTNTSFGVSLLTPTQIRQILQLQSNSLDSITLDVQMCRAYRRIPIGRKTGLKDSVECNLHYHCSHQPTSLLHSQN